MNKKYNIGLDIGTTSVGWSVVEANTQKIIRRGKGKNRKALWGVRLFDEASTAEGRRNARNTRRRYDRRRERIKLLQNEFKNEINKVDSNFYTKLRESKYNEKDKINKTILLTTNEKDKVKEYNEKYPTIYHLRNRLIEDVSKEDIRLVYLAIHHIIKYRGNFLYSGDNLDVNNLNLQDKLKDVFENIMNESSSMHISEDIQNQLDYQYLENIIMDKSKNDIKANIKKELNDLTDNKKFSTEFSKLIVGNKFTIKDLLMLDTDNKLSISFDGTDYEDKYTDLEELLGDEISIISILKELYDLVFLKKLFKGSKNTSISSLMIEKYDKHKKHLKYLKELFNYNRQLYREIFRTTEKYTCVYDQYIHNKLTYEEFKKSLEKYLEQIWDYCDNTELKEKYVTDIKISIDNDEFLPRIADKENGKYPYQLNKSELIKIIENQGKYYPFLKEKINDKYKIVKLLEFRIPYYVGPLNKDSKFAWLERKDKVKITPYNFDEVIDKEKTAEKFITRMISHCTYLLKEDALPNNSILYCKFKVMNELKQIKVNNRKIENDIQTKIIRDLFMKESGTITDTKFKKYLYASSDFNMYEGDINITGYSADGKFANNMQSYIDFFGENGIFNDTSYTEDEAEEIIRWITIFDDKDILIDKVKRTYPEINNENLKKIASKKYKGWGSLSKKLLSTKYYYDEKNNTKKSILDLMQETDENFMQIINNDKYKFQDMINEENEISENTKLNYSLVEDLATSPATKRGIYQSLKVVDELIDYMGYKPESVIIEMARGEDKKKERKDDRKKYLEKLFESAKKEAKEYNSEIDKMSNQLKNIEKIDSEKLFLYFIQEGKCMYSGKPLNIEDLNSYEVDHILPRSIIKDDSIENKALVYRECNQNKGASLVLPSEYRTSYMKKWWRHLKDIKLISSKKFYSLTRDKYKDEDIQGFINRQIVETRQITKHVANIINNLYDVKVIYLKANLSHNYRERYELYKFRDLNDYHHAFDAYLAAVLGEYKEKYMKRNINYEMVKELNNEIRNTKDYKKLNYGFVINSLDSDFYDIVNKISKNIYNEETGEVYFDADDFNKRVEDTYYRNDVLISRKTEIRSGRLFKETIFPKGEGKVMLKNNMPTNMYGGYSNIETSYMSLIKYNNKVRIVGIPLEVAIKSNKNVDIKGKFIKEHLKIEDDSKYEIIKDYIPYDALIDYHNQKVYIKGYSSSHKNCEISNAYQMKIKKGNMKEWKYVFNKILNNKKTASNNDKLIIDEEKQLKISKDILEYLFNQKNYFPLFEREITKIENTIDLNNITFDDISKIIIELLKIYHCNSVNGNLKNFGLGDRIGRLSGFNIDSGIMIFNSYTGLKQDTYRISEDLK